MGKTNVQVTNLTEDTVILPKDTEIADAIPFIEQQMSNEHEVTVSRSTELPESDLLSHNDRDLDHLEPTQKVQLFELLREMNIIKTLHQGKLMKKA